MQSEGFLDLPDERLAHLGHRRGPLASRFHGRLAERRRADPRLVEEIEEFEVGADVERQTMVGDPSIHGDTHRGEPRGPGEDAGQVGPRCAGEVEFLEDLPDRGVQPVHVALARSGRRASSGMSDIGRELTREVEDAAAAAIDVVGPDPHPLEQLLVRGDVGPAAGSPDADRRRVLAKDQRRAPLLAQLVDDPSLKLLELGEVDQPQHVDFQRRRFGGWPHRWLNLLPNHGTRFHFAAACTSVQDSDTLHFECPGRQVEARAGTAPAAVLAMVQRHGLSARTGVSGRLDDGAPGEQPVALLLVDPQPGQQAVADRAQCGLDRGLLRIGQDDRPAGPPVVAAGTPHPVDHRLEDLAGAAAELARPERELHLPVEDARRQRPVHLIETDEEVGDLRDDVGLGHRCRTN